MDDCPDNSTACLLVKLIQLNQQILDGINDSNNEFNWDPASFAITLAIGVLAFIVACITVFQGILAAGPGRIKAGKTAIGPWSRGSRSRFSWTELGVRSTAIIPVIEINGWNDAARPWGSVPEHSDQMDLTEFEEHGATWVNLLSFLGMTEVVWTKYKTIGTDYLPADVQGPPATVHMKSLITLAAIADDYCSIKASAHDTFVNLTGLYTSVSIREHPVLGTVAAFELHGTPRTALPQVFVHSKRDLGLAQEKCGDEEMASRSSAFDLTSSYALGEGRLATGLGIHDLAKCRWRDIEADILRVRAGFFMVDKRTLWLKASPTIFTALITAKLPSRPRMLPKQPMGPLAYAARDLAGGSMWLEDSTFPDQFEHLLQNYIRLESADLGMSKSRTVWDSLMNKEFDYPWTELQKAQRLGIAANNLVEWTNFRQTPLPAQSGVLPYNLKVHGVTVTYDSRRKAVILKRVMERICTGFDFGRASVIKAMFTGLDVAALQVGFQAEMLTLDYYLMKQNEEDVACALMVLLKDISLNLDGSERMASQHTDHGVLQSDSGSHDGAILSCLNNVSYEEAYGLGQAPAEFSVDTTPEGRIKLRPDRVQTVQKEARKHMPELYMTSPADCPPEWKHLWYSRQGVEHRQRITLLAEILRYRALLCIAVLDLCADSTILMSEHFDRAMVRMI